MSDIPVIGYTLHGNSYLNVTNRCTLRCAFCPKFNGEWTVQEHELRLRADQEPDAPALVAAAEISGGGLQSVSIGAALLKDVDLYFFDEPSSYLDIYHRLKVAKIIKELSEKKKVLVIEHDLAVLDFLCDNVHLMYGDEGAYGVVTHPRVVRHAINEYLSGYLKEENIRFGEKIEFFAQSPKHRQQMNILISYSDLTKTYADFSLDIESGIVRQGEIIGVVGPNAIGKTTFVKQVLRQLHKHHCLPFHSLHG